MVLRILVILVALVAVERAASACCLGCACTKYKREVVIIEEKAFGYSRSVAGGLPRWSVARITKFLTTGTWQPLRPVAPKMRRGAAAPEPELDTPDNPRHTRVIQPAPAIRFVTADRAGQNTKSPAHEVLIRRIEKRGNAILVEVNARTFKLAACRGKRTHTCLVEPGDLALAPIPPPGDTQPTDGFAKPPSGR